MRVWSRLLQLHCSQPLLPFAAYSRLLPSIHFTLSCFTIYGHFHALPFLQPIPGLHTIYPAYSSPLTIKTLTIFPSPAFLLFCAHQCISFSCITLFLVTSYLPTYLPTYLPLEHCIDCSLVLVFSCLLII